MKNVFCLLLMFCFTILFSQSKIKVYNSENKLPIKGAQIFCNNQLIVETDANGNATFTSQCAKVEVVANGYISEEVDVDAVMQLALDKESKTNEIQEVVISDKSDPVALAILDKVYKKHKDNSPNALDSYAYKSYEKMFFDVDQDSIQIFGTYVDKRKDSLSRLSNREFSQSNKKEKDSLNGEKMLELMKTSQLFLWERVTEFLYSKKYGEKINVLDNRISGLQDPIYEMLTLRSNRNKIPKEILPENRNLYRYFLTDSLEIDGRQNFVIRFREVDYKLPAKRRKFSGYLYIDTETYAIKKLESNSKKKSDGSIVSVWTPVDNKWFLKSENLKMRMGSTSFSSSDKKDNETPEEAKQRKEKTKKIGNYAYMKVDYFDFEAPVDLKSSQFKGYTMSVKNTDGSLLDQYRTESLSEREQNTYLKIDSIGKDLKLDQKVKVFTTLLRGNLRINKVDINPFHSGYNRYEGFRLGVGLKLNEKFNPYISPDVYVAYGFKDGAFKYGVGVDFRTTLERESFFRIEYFDDVQESGRFNQNLWNMKMKFMNTGVALKNDKYYKYNGFKFSYQVDLTNSLTLNVSAKRQYEDPTFDYVYRYALDRYTNFSTLTTIRYSPNNKNIMTPSGKYTFEQTYPEVFFNYEQGIKTFGGDFNFSRLDLLFVNQFRTALGLTGTRFYGGYFVGEAPIWHMFEMGGLDASIGDKKLFSHFNLTTYLGFATMPAGRFFSDKFAGYYFSHQLPWHFKSFGKNTSSLDLVYKGIVGGMKDSSLHQFDYSTLKHLYQEVGVEYNNFLSSQFNLGLFYRVGYYSTNKFMDNFAIQLKLKILGF